VHYPVPVRDHTERMLAAMAAPLRWDALASSLMGPVNHLAPAGGGQIEIPGDLSSAAFLLAAAAILPGSRLRIAHVGINPGRTGILEILRAMGAPVGQTGWDQSGGEPFANLSVAQAELSAIGVGQPLVPRAIDELPLLAVLGSRARGRTVLIEAGELRLKESDRIAAICEGLGRMGARIRPSDEGFVVEGPTELHGAEVEGHADHRIVMSLTVAALAASGRTRIRGAERCADSFPGFVEALRGLGAELHEEPES
jgi:3-phosphoshikimate 1-carboxyvinyltransferase